MIALVCVCAREREIEKLSVERGQIDEGITKTATIREWNLKMKRVDECGMAGRGIIRRRVWRNKTNTRRRGENVCTYILTKRGKTKKKKRYTFK